MKLDSRITRSVAAVALIALVAAPMSAWAVPGRGASKAPKANASRSTTAAVKLAGKKQALTDRIAKVLANRTRAFNNAASAITARIAKVEALASTVAGAGGDVQGVLDKLDAAKAAVDAAKAAEATAVDMFKAVPSATDKKAAFSAAKAQAKAARMKLTDARSLLRNAILALEVVINGLQPVTP